MTPINQIRRILNESGNSRLIGLAENILSSILDEYPLSIDDWNNLTDSIVLKTLIKIRGKHGISN